MRRRFMRHKKAISETATLGADLCVTDLAQGRRRPMGETGRGRFMHRDGPCGELAFRDISSPAEPARCKLIRVTKRHEIRTRATGKSHAIDGIESMKRSKPDRRHALELLAASRGGCPYAIG